MKTPPGGEQQVNDPVGKAPDCIPSTVRIIHIFLVITERRERGGKKPEFEVGQPKTYKKKSSTALVKMYGRNEAVVKKKKWEKREEKRVYEKPSAPGRVNVMSMARQERAQTPDAVSNQRLRSLAINAICISSQINVSKLHK